MTNIFFTSDAHLFHDNIRRFCGRPYYDIEDMNSSLINNWNSVCDKNSVVYFLGDFALKCSHIQVQKILSQLNFHTLYFIKGNHEKAFSSWYNQYVQNKYTLSGRVMLLPPLYETKIEDKHVVMCHYPLDSWNKQRYGSYMLSGHCHGNNKRTNPATSDANMVDVGVDCWDYKPASWQQIKEHMEK